MADQKILREYLLALGFKVDERSQGKFDFALDRGSRGALLLAKRAAGAALAVQALVAVWARSMEKLYYVSKRTDSTVEQIKALEYGASRVGVSGDMMRGSLEAMARALRTNPGLQGLLNDLGVKVEGRDKSDVLVDLVKQLKGMPFYVAQQYASLFGIDGDTLLMLQQGVEELEKARAARKEMAAAAGLDTDKAAEAAKEYSNQLREIGEMFGILKDTAMVALLEPMKQVAGVVKEMLKDWTRIIKEFDNVPDFFKRLVEGIAGKAGGARVTLSKDSRDRIAAGVLDSPFGNVQSGSSTSTKQEAPTSLFDRLEKHYGLPAGLLDKMWLKESARGQRMRSPAGAEGHFQFMPDTAKEQGLKDPYDLAQSAEAASKYLAMLMTRYGGDIQKALAAYNWGMGNVDRKGLASAPWETQDYVHTLSGRPITIHQTTTIQVATADPMAAGRMVAREQDKVNANIIRNTYGAVDVR